MIKSKRHSKIIEIINNNDITSQGELINKLNEAGYTVTQATVSRDMRELGINKEMRHGKRVFGYNGNSIRHDDRYVNVLKTGFVSIDKAMNLLVIRTVPGMAMAVAAAIDALEFAELLGSIAGDDTIMCATRNEADATSLMAKLKEVTDDAN